MPGWNANKPVELLTWDPSDGPEGEGDDVDDELPARLSFEGAAADSSGGDAAASAGHADADAFTVDRQPAAREARGDTPSSSLPSVKASSFRRVLR